MQGSLAQRISLPACCHPLLSPLLPSSSSSSSSSFSSQRLFPLSAGTSSVFSSCCIFFFFRRRRQRRCLQFSSCSSSSSLWCSLLPVCSRALRWCVVEGCSIHTARDCGYTSADLEMMELEDKDLLRKQAALFLLSKGVKFSYGTAGFRTDAALLPSTVFRMGVLAALRSLCTKRATGLMIMASHNPVHENGVKLADPSGGMLNVAWEPYSDMLANAPDVENFLQIVEHIVKREKIQSGNAARGEVLLARDTRPSGEALVLAACQVKVKDRVVIITTPDETRVASPSSLQEAIDTEVGKYKGGRAIVRPSGTEDVVRVYAEASSQQSADALAQAVCVLVYHLSGGVGPEP